MFPLKKRLIAEFLGTFILIFAGTGAIIINEVTGGTITHPAIALAFGIVVMAMIYTFGDVSGAHLNPAVTIAFAAANRFSWRETPYYIIFQITGAIAASLIWIALYPENLLLGSTFPRGSYSQSFIIEFIMSAILMTVILSVSTGSKEKGITAGIAIGGTIALEALLAGPISGASMNPARSIGPAIASGHLQSLWIYLTAPVIGTLFAIPLCRLVRDKDCCNQNC